MNSITINAYAKINLGLDVLRRREDGYHDVCMIMQSLKLHDTLTISKTTATGIVIETNHKKLPVDHNNLIYKAVLLFFKTFAYHDGIRILLDKQIPIAAGLAGGSSDAAATLKGLNELYGTGLTQQELMKLGVQLGADVPYCILLGTALSEGIGEVLSPLASLPECYVLLVKPDISVSTRYVYENLKLNSNRRHPDIPSMKASLEEGSLARLAGFMDNILQTVTVEEYPIISQIKQKMSELGALTSLMSGSGPTVFGIYTDLAAAKQAYEYFKANQGYGRQIFLTEPYQPGVSD